MANTNLTIDMITREALEIAHEKCNFLGTINRDYDDSFAKVGAKQGSTLRIRNPNQFTRRTGSRVMDIQDTLDTSQTLTVATQDGVDIRFNSAELSLSIDDFNKRYLEPAMAVLVSNIEADVLVDVTKSVYNLAGTAGTVVGASGDISAIGAARAKLNQQLAPQMKGSRFLQLDSVTMGSVTNGIKSLFQPGEVVANAFKEGLVGRSQMADFYENERTWTMSNAADVAGTLDSYTVIEGDDDLTVTGFSAAPTAGMVFTIDGVYDCHPETKQAYSHLKQFVVLTGSTTTDLNFSPTIRLTGARKNVTASDGGTAAPSTTAAITFVGSASTSYRQNLMYHKDAFTFVTADLPIMDDAHKCVRRNKDGLALRVWQASDIKNDELLMRIDILYGWKATRPEWACRITN